MSAALLPATAATGLLALSGQATLHLLDQAAALLAFGDLSDSLDE